MTEDFITLEEYAKCVQKCLTNIIHDYQMAKDEQPIIMYANAPVAYAKTQEHFKNGSNVGPLITFYQSGIEIDKSQQMGGWKNIAVERQQGNYLYRAPIICSINYTVTINALTELQADMLQVQIMQATPFHRPYYDKLNGQFVLIESTDCRNLGTVDTGENKDKIVKREITLKIDRAYLNYDINELNAGTIYINDDNPEESLEKIITVNEIISNMLKNNEKVFDINGEEIVNDNEYLQKLINEGNRFFDINGNKIVEKTIAINNKKIIEKLDNGENIYEDHTTSGKIVKNTSNGYTPFIYNVANKDGKIINKTNSIGKLKVTLYSLEK